MHVRHTVLAVVLAASASCALPAASRGTAQPDVRIPSAVIGRDYARFVFPNQTHTPWVKPAPSERYPGEVDGYLWLVEWRVEKQGADPQQISVVARWPKRHPPEGPLSEMVRSADVDVGTLCSSCEPTALTLSRDSVFRAPAITAQMMNGAVVVSVTGRAAVSRLFRRRPDSVWFSITPPDGYLEPVTVAVKKR